MSQQDVIEYFIARNNQWATMEQLQHDVKKNVTTLLYRMWRIMKTETYTNESKRLKIKVKLKEEVYSDICMERIIHDKM